MITDEEIEQAYCREFGLSYNKFEVAFYMARWMEKRVLLELSKDFIQAKADETKKSIDKVINLMQS